MSHAANLRNRQHALQSAAGPSSKRRKPSPSTTDIRSNGTATLANGASIADTTLAAIPSRNAKSSEAAKDNAAHIQHGSQLTNGAHGKEDLDMEDASSGEDKDSQSDSSSEDGTNDDDDDDDDDDDSEVESDEEVESDTQPKNLTNHQTSPRNEPQTSGGSTGSHKVEAQGKALTQTAEHDSSAMGQNEDVEETEEGAEPSFGDLLRQRAPEAIDVEAEMAEEEEQTTSNKLALAPRNTQLSVPTAASLGTVLAQALRTNDLDLLETCLQMQNLDSIRATIERLHSPLSSILIQRLAERLHRRPGRAGSLMVWVQWTIVAHGGYLATQPAAMNEVRTLYRVVKSRASALQPLLALKGKLDMLEAQLQLRRNMQSRNHRDDAIDDEENVVYVEGEESDSDELEDDEAPLGTTKGGADVPTFDADSDDDAEALADVDGINDEDDLEEDDDELEDDEDELEDEDDDSEEENVFDEEAEESENDSDDEGMNGVDDVEFDEDDSLSESGNEDSMTVERRPQKRSKLSRV